MSTIYLDHNATTAPLPAVVSAVSECLSHAWGNPSSMHRRGQLAKGDLNEARARVASLLGAGPAEIVFTSGATESNHTAILGALSARPGRQHIVASRVEHPSTLQLLNHLQGQGVSVSWIEVDAQGRIDAAHVARALRPDTALVTVMWANNETGVIHPVAEIARICKAHDVLFHTDAVQAVGKLDVNVREVAVDLLSVSAHKLHGPVGIGALFVRKGLNLQPLLFGHQERKRRGGTENLPGIVGFGVAALELAVTWRDTVPRLAALRDHFERGLRARLPQARINGESVLRLPNTSNFAIGGLDAEAVLDGLDLLGIFASSGSACTAGGTEPSHVLTAMGQESESALAALRFSFGRDNTEAEIDRVLELLPSIVARYPDSLVAT